MIALQAQVAEQLRKSRRGIVSRKWTGEDNARLQGLVGEGFTYAQAAESLGRTSVAVEQHARLIGLSVNPGVDTVSFRKTILAAHMMGMTDREIAGHMGVCPNTVLRVRKLMKLPNNKSSQHYRDRRKLFMRKAFMSRGVMSLAGLRQKNNSLESQLRGWPASMTPRMCDILEILEDGAKTRDEIRTALGAEKMAGMVTLHKLVRRGAVRHIWLNRSGVIPKGSVRCRYELVIQRRSLA